MVSLAEYAVRCYEKGDEKEIVRLFNQVYGAYGGFVPRTEEYWRWCCLLRPDVTEDGILLVREEETKRLCGYAVVGLNGDVWEFCAGDDRGRVASTLLAGIIKYLESAGVSSVRINVPDEVVLDRVLEEEGFARIRLERMFVSTLSPRALLSALVGKKELQFNEEIAFEFQDAPPGVENVSVRIHGGMITISDGLSESATVVVKCRFLVLLSVLFGVSSLRRAFLAGRIHVKPFWKASEVLRFLNFARLRSPWFWPLGDYG